MVGSAREMVGFMHEVVESPKEMDRAAREVLGFMREMVISANGTAGSACERVLNSRATQSPTEMVGFAREMLGFAREMLGLAREVLESSSENVG